MLRTWRDFFTAVLFFLLNFFVVGNVAWVCHVLTGINSKAGQIAP